MIAFLSGTVAAVLPPQTAYIDVAGVGYAVAMPGGDLGKLAVGDTARVLTYLSVTENGIALFGFLSEEEKHAAGQPLFSAAASASASASRSAWSFKAANRLRTRMRAAPKFDTSSIFSTVYTLPAASSTSCTWSVVSASRPQPKEFN